MKVISDSGNSRAVVQPGDRFGRWTVIAFHGVHRTNRVWLCRCSCGTVRPVLQCSLRSKKSASCGCAPHRRWVWRRQKTLSERLFSLIDVQQPDECWPWIGYIKPNGYGTLHIKINEGKFRPRYAHRLLYVELFGLIPDGWHVDHLCRNRLCMNPKHLEAVPRYVNLKRRDNAKTHCKNGHEFTPENIRWQRTYHRVCRICENARHREYGPRK